MIKTIKKFFRKKRLHFEQGDIVETNGHIVMVNDWRPLDIYYFNGTALIDGPFCKVGQYDLWNKFPGAKKPRIKRFLGRIIIENREEKI